MRSTLERIKEFIDFKSLSIRAFEQSIGYSNGAFSSQLKNNKSIGSDKLENILSAYPELSPEWLLTGVGDMLKSDIKPTKEFTKDAPYKNTPKTLHNLAERNYFKLRTYFDDRNTEQKELMHYINTIEVFRDLLGWLNSEYFEDLNNVVFENMDYLKGNKFDFQAYKSDVEAELIKLDPIREPLKNISTAIEQFYTEFKKVDSKKVIENNLL